MIIKVQPKNTLTPLFLNEPVIALFEFSLEAGGTVITLVNGQQIIVKESCETIASFFNKADKE